MAWRVLSLGESGSPYSIILVDGGGILGYGELLILANILKEIPLPHGEESNSGEICPCDYFDVITGCGIGGVIALLLGRLRLTLAQCLLESRTLSTCILRESWGGPLFDQKKPQEVADGIVERYCHTPSAPLLEDDITSRGKTNDHNSVPIRISDAMVALLSARGQLDEVSLETSDGLTSFSDDLYSCGLRNPILDVLKELREHWSDQTIGLILSIGTGGVPPSDIPDLLRLGKLHDLMIPSLSDLALPWKLLAERLAIFQIIGMLEDNERYIKNKLHYMGYEDKYNRFEIGPVQDTGPNDFRSVKEIADETGCYLIQHSERLVSLATQLQGAGVSH
ncbi:FabD/lysophospholipase-like protein [Aspergillus brunneoviolaceus CBS 621.78]|uniref:FabD/lysophospholipase-like protein n=1 Tax=Aspergillus brunneoviolaceus CBS 621.78 TaxID=1450534 RepID=A0ACD1G2N7_9EURO|nr:FabD/lysophospholipase-like protein [Aspergillus brunneoviolaceus CBS 621.78]RAH43487.1 FabD/lysophospholipase-like protein [Aspergillus brunneoviolaceus CBS 621.78]